jgi:hypothetical protein
MQSLEVSNQRHQQHQQGQGQGQGQGGGQQQQPLISLNSTPDSVKRSEGPWDAILRSVCRGGMFWEDVIPPKNRPVPLHILSHSHSHSQSTSAKDFELETGGGGGGHGKGQSQGHKKSKSKRLMRVLSLSYQANLAMMIADDDLGSSSSSSSSTTLLPSTAISQWTLLQTFILDTVQDIQSLFHSQLFRGEEHDDSGERGQGSEGDALTFAVKQALSQDQPELPGLVNLLLHIMHATGHYTSPSPPLPASLGSLSSPLCRRSCVGTES